MSSSFLNRKTPGVYVTEFDAFPLSVVGVQTAVPAFIGYTEKAELSGKPVSNQPIQITSMAEYESTFGGRYSGVYGFTEVTDSAQIGQQQYAFTVTAYTEIAGQQPRQWKTPAPKYFGLLNPALRFYLYDSMQLFFANGGGSCYVVSVGTYETAVTKDALLAGLQAIQSQTGPTMLVIPDATLLPPTAASAPGISADFQSVVQAMLQQAQQLGDRVAIPDIYGTTLISTNVSTKPAQPIPWETVIGQFQKDIGGNSLDYGFAYFPFLVTTVLQSQDFSFTNFTPIDDNTAPIDLKTLLTWANVTLNGFLQPDGVAILPAGSPGETLQQLIDSMPAVARGGDALQITKLSQQLASALPLMKQMLTLLATRENVLPPSGALAGAITNSDSSRGVWNAPANIGLTSVVDTTFKINDEQQGTLNIPINGKAVNAIRNFVGRGVVVWGARTFDGNSNDWRYIQVRRTIIYIEQSIKNALTPYVFAANDGKTWVTVTSMVSNFLQSVWSQGGLMGNKASDAFTVQCGLGSTMTAQDILDGYMVVQVTVQMIRPAEFIELTFKQKMQGT